MKVFARRLLPAVPALLCLSLVVHAGPLERVGPGSAVIDADGASRGAVMSADGRYLVFHSDSADLDPRDPDVSTDVYVRDRSTGSTTLLSIGNDGAKGNFDSFWPAISRNGRFVVFSSFASNLVPGDTNNTADVYLVDRDANRNGMFDEAGAVLIRRVSRASDGTEANAFSAEATISADGRYVVFASEADNLVPGDTNQVADIFVHDIASGITERVSVSGPGAQANDMSSEPALSADGRYIAFSSSADNLAPGDANGRHWRGADIYVRDRLARTTALVSLAAAGVGGNGRSEQPAISADGRYIAFMSRADNLTGRDSNGAAHVFVHDRDADANGIFDEPARTSIELVSIAFDGGPARADSAWPSISADGRYIAFQSRAPILIDAMAHGAPVWRVFVRDRVAATTTPASGTGDDGIWPSISADGRQVAFWSDPPLRAAPAAGRVTDVMVYRRAAPDAAADGVAAAPPRAAGSADI